MPRWIARLAAGRAPVRLAHRAVFSRFAEALAARSPRVGLPRVREV
jgi:hypothetical protein